jgi:hypothetical protein
MTTTYLNSISYLNAQHYFDADQLGYVDTVLRGSSFLSLLPIVDTSHFMRDEYMEKNRGTTKNTQKRKLNEEPDKKSKNRFVKRTELTSIYTVASSIDYRVAEEYPQQHDDMMMSDAEDMMMDIDYDIIKGVPDASGYGLRGLEDRVPISNSGYDVNNAATLTINTSATTMKTFLRLFRKAVRKIKRAPGMVVAAFMHENTELAIQSGRDELGANVVGTGTFDILNQPVTTIEGVPLVVVREDSAGNSIIGFDENSENSTSIWIVGFQGGVSEGSKKIPQGVTVLSGDQVIRRYSERIGLQINTFQEMDVQLRTPPGSVARLSRLLVA